MSYKYLDNIELEVALTVYLQNIKSECKSLEKEEIAVQNSLGRVTSEAVIAKISSPHYNACAMDGIAVFARNTFGATETTPVILKEGIDFKRVDTGDPLPDNFDSVVMIEDVIEMGEETLIGEDICAGEMIIPSNTRIEPSAIGSLLAGGILNISVWKKPVVGIIPSGDEIVMPTDNPKEGEIIEFNSSIFSAMLESWGSEVKVYDIVPDKYEIIREEVDKASKECDLVLLNAGSSAGREDFSSKVIENLGKVLVHGIAIRPGKPTILGIVNKCPVIGVPGYPVSGIIVMETAVKKVLELLLGVNYPSGEKVKATISRKLISSLKYKEFVRVKIGEIAGQLVATPLNRGAGVVTSFMKADGILEVPHNSEGYENGQEINIQLLRNREEIQNTLVIMGSHDPLIDVVTDIIRKNYQNEYVSSVHVGSIGGIMALKRNETHASGIHLLDEQTGEYNISYIKKYFGNSKIFLIKGVKRVQGFMVAPGNPKSIKEISDICLEGISYVNRQKGSGTRILLDYLLKKNGKSASSIYGYEREEFTHMTVGALIASGKADAGMGIYSAAKIYGLDFIPVCEEEYDFIIPERYIGLEKVQHFIEVLKSKQFKEELHDMGGYTFENIGEILEVNV